VKDADEVEVSVTGGPRDLVSGLAIGWRRNEL
jgi:hypothetical protein